MEGAVDRQIAALVAQMRDTFHYDFSGYAPASLKRRIVTAVARMQLGSVENLSRRLERDPDAFTQLLRYITVPHTDLFRDPDYFAVLRAEVVPFLSTYPSIKIWVPGCSTGEEVYSLAILLLEEGLLSRTLIYATDISPHALQVAEAGIYEIDRVAAFSANHRRSGARTSLSEHYHADYGRIVFDKALKKRVVFSDHSLATDSVFAEVQVVSCRNVLIYFDRALQNRAIGLFRDALCPLGFLGLGSRETLRFSAHEAAFRPFHEAACWYRRC
jgi:chemotaxis protein methyltransferase CheR